MVIHLNFYLPLQGCIFLQKMKDKGFFVKTGIPVAYVAKAFKFAINFTF